MRRLRWHDEDGLGLVEVVIAMFVMALIAIAFLPFLATNYTAIARNSEIASATQLLAKQFDELRTLTSLETPATCAALTAFEERVSAADVLDVPSRDLHLTVEREFECPTALPRTAAFVISVHDEDGKRLAEASTIVYVRPEP